MRTYVQYSLQISCGFIYRQYLVVVSTSFMMIYDGVFVFLLCVMLCFVLFLFQVTKLTPLPDISGHACVWTDAIYAAMQLQTFPVEETVDIRERYFERKALLQEEGGDEEEENREEGANCRDVEEGGGFDKQRASMNVDYHKVGCTVHQLPFTH